MNPRNYEISVICDFLLLHLLVNLGSIPDFRKLLSLECNQALQRDEEVENRNDSQQLTPHFGSLLDWHHETKLI